MTKSKDKCDTCKWYPMHGDDKVVSMLWHCHRCARTERRERERLEADIYRLAEWETAENLYESLCVVTLWIEMKADGKSGKPNVDERMLRTVRRMRESMIDANSYAAWLDTEEARIFPARIARRRSKVDPNNTFGWREDWPS